MKVQKRFLYEKTHHSAVRVLVFGAGAMGSLIGGVLSRENEVILIGREQHVGEIQRNGLRITGKTDVVIHPQAKTALDGAERPDWVIVATKSYDTDEAMKALKPFHKESVFISLQNGLDNEAIISNYASKVIGGVTSHGVTVEEPGKIYHAGIGRTVIGNFKNAEDNVHEIAEAFVKAGIETEVTSDIRREIWKKAIVNAGINPLTAITMQKNGFILENPNLTMTLETICQEAVTVANAQGFDISADEAIRETKEVVRLTADNKSSMLQDIERGRKTEIESICGAIAKLGMEKGIPTPVNSSLLAIVRGLEVTHPKSRL